MSDGFRLGRAWQVGLGLVALLGGAAWIQTENPTKPVPALPVLAELDAREAGAIDTSKIPEHVASDPVFQELSRAFLNAGQTASSVPFVPSKTSDGVWHVIESTLRAARQLEVEEAKLKAAGEIEKANRHREVIDNLRLQGARLLANELQVTIS